MKKVVSGFIAIAISFASIAQSQKANHKKHKGDHKEFKHKGGKKHGQSVTFSDAQQNQLKAINENFRNQMKAVQADNTLTKEVQKQKRDALKDEHRAQIKAVLTPEQRQQWEERMQREDKGKAAAKMNKRVKKEKSWKQTK